MYCHAATLFVSY